MDRYYQTDGIHSYMVISDIFVQPESYEIKMIQKNDFSELLSFEFRMLDNQQQLYYKVDNLVEISDLKQEGEFAGNDVIRCMDFLFSLIFKLQAYLLIPDNLVLELDGIFYCKQTESFYFLYLPGYGTDIRKQITGVVEKLLRMINHKQRQSVDFIYGLYEQVSVGHYDLQTVWNYVKSYVKTDDEKKHNFYHRIITENTERNTGENIGKITGEDEAKQIQRNELLDLVFSQEEAARDLRKNKDMEKREIYKYLLIGFLGLLVFVGFLMALMQLRQCGKLYQIKPMMIILVLMAVDIYAYLCVKKAILEKEKTILEEEKCVQKDMIVQYKDTEVLSAYGEETTVLREADCMCEEATGQKQKPVIYRLVPENKASADVINLKETIVIGRDDKCADVCLADFTVSRKHAKIYREHERLLLEDLDSTNGTFLNQKEVLQGFPVDLQPGDHVRFGETTYCLEKDMC